MDVVIRNLPQYRFTVLGEKTAVQIRDSKPQLVRIIQAAPVGGGGGSPLRVTYTQVSALQTWIFNHNLGYFPDISVFSPGGVEVEAAVTHTSVNQVVINFEIPYSGFAIAS